jgi:hypothetical protein
MTAGAASVIDKRGRTYHGFVTLSSGMVQLTGWRRVGPWHGVGGEFETRYPVHRVWPISRIDRIDWTDQARVAA